MKLENGYTVPVNKPGKHLVNWGGDTEAFVVDIIHCKNGMVKVWVSDTEGQQEGWVMRGAVEGDNVLDFVRLLRDEEDYDAAPSGYYVSFANDPIGERGTGGYDPETGEFAGFDMIKWVAPR